MGKTSAGSRAAARRSGGKPTRGNDAVTRAAEQSTARARFARVHSWVTLVFRLVLAGVLGYAGALKVGDPLTAARAVRAYQLLPNESLVKAIGYGLPFLELVLAVLLVVGLGTRLSGIAAGALMLVFIVGIISVWARGISIDCGCFGGGGEVAAGETQYPSEILRDVGLLVAAAWVAVFPSGRFALDGKLLGDPIEGGK